MLILDLCARAPLREMHSAFPKSWIAGNSSNRIVVKFFPNLFLPKSVQKLSPRIFSERGFSRDSFENELFKPNAYYLERILDEIPGVGVTFRSYIFVATVAKPSIGIYLTLKILRELLRYQSRVRGACATNKQGERKGERVKERAKEKEVGRRE